MEGQSANFMDLKLSPGQLFQLQFEGYTDEREKSILVGYRRNASIIVTLPVGLSIKAGEKINVRFFYGRKSSACAFQTEVVSISKVPFPHMYLKMPEEVLTGEVRQNVRADVEVVARVEFDQAGTTETTTAKIVDLSLNGARIIGRKFDFVIGTEVKLIFQINVTGIEYEVTVEAIARSIQEMESGVSVGLQFHDLPANDKIALQAFVLTHINDL